MNELRGGLKVLRKRNNINVKWTNIIQRSRCALEKNSIIKPERKGQSPRKGVNGNRRTERKLKLCEDSFRLIRLHNCF